MNEVFGAPGRRRRTVVLAVAGIGAVSLIATAAVVWSHLRQPATTDNAPGTNVQRTLSLAEAFPRSKLARLPAVRREQGKVSPSGLLPDGTVYGITERPAGKDYVTVAVTVDPRTGRRTVIREGNPDVSPRFIAANERWLLGVTEMPPPSAVGSGCVQDPAACGARGPVPPPRLWCHDRSTGQTLDITAVLRKAGYGEGSNIALTDTSIVFQAGPIDQLQHLAMDGCTATPHPLGFPLLPQSKPLGAGLVMAVQDDGGVRGYRVMVQDTRSGLTRTVLHGSGDAAAANVYGLAWHPRTEPITVAGTDATAGTGTTTTPAPPEPQVRYAPWGGTAHALTIPTITGARHLTVVAANDRALLLADQTEPLGELALYDPVRGSVIRLGKGHAWGFIHPFAAGRYFVWDDGSPDGYRWLDLGPQPAPPARSLEDLQVRD